MPRTRSTHVEAVRKHLLERLQSGYQFAGGRFPSARELAARYGISYQTADRLLRGLVEEGLVERRQGSGTFVVGSSAVVPSRAMLIFNPRAAREGSFGGELHTRLCAALGTAGVPHHTVWDEAAAPLTAADLPVVWESGETALEETARGNRFALMLNSRPKPGMQATWVDSISVDDFSGGVCAGQILSLTLGGKRNAAVGVLGGPKRDARSQGRIAGFTSILPKARVFPADTWFAEEAAPMAAKLAAAGLDAVFCCNDRLAQAVVNACAAAGVPLPKLVGFDDAPIARELGLTTVAMPWDGLVQQAVSIIQRRLSGDAGHAAQILYAPRPVQRWG